MPETVKNLKIIAVSDVPSDLFDIKDILKSYGVSEILEAQNPADGIKIAGNALADLMICFYNSCHDYAKFFQSLRDGAVSSPPPVLFVFDKAGKTEITAIMELGADDYIEKSLCKNIIHIKLQSLISIKKMKEELSREKRRVKDAKDLLLKNFKNFKELTSILLKILEVRIPGAGDRAERAKVIAEFLTEKLGIEEEKRRKIVFAAIMHELGKVGLPDDIAGKDYTELSPDELAVYKQFTVVGSMIISTMTGFKESADAIYHQLENHDGSGFPDGLMGDQIHLGARIIRAIVLLEHFGNMGLSDQEIIDKVRHVMNRTLDKKIANLIIEFILDKGKKSDCKNIKIPLDKLKTGMVTAEDVYAASGIKLIPKGVKVKEKMIEIIMERNSMDPIIGGIYIECQAVNNPDPSI